MQHATAVVVVVVVVVVALMPAPFIKCLHGATITLSGQKREEAAGHGPQR